MYKSTKFALAAAGALIVSGCATSAWQPMPGHPADPSALSGAATPITTLSRYRKQTQALPATPEKNAGDTAPHDMDHMDHGEEQQ